MRQAARLPQTSFDYATLDAETRIVVQQRTGEIRTIARRAAADIIEIGDRLSEVKTRLGHGQFGAWLSGEFGWSQESAQRFMRVAERFQNRQIDGFAPSALYMLASPAVPEEARQEALARAAQGQRIGVKAARQIAQAHQPDFAPVWALEPGVRHWLAPRAATPEAQIELLTAIQDRTTAGLIALEELLTCGDLAAPRRKPDVLLAVGRVLAGLRQAAGDRGQAETGGRGQESGIRAQTADVPRVSAAWPAADRAPRAGLAPEPALLPNPPASVCPVAQTFPLTIGGVTIMHADSRLLLRHVTSASAHLVITSPPYNVGLTYNSYHDNLPVADHLALLRTVFANCQQALVPGGRLAVVVPFGTSRSPWQPLAAQVTDLLTGLGFGLRGQITWDKGTTGNRTTWGSFRLPTNPTLRDRTEAILVAHTGAGKLAVPADALQRDDKGAYSPLLPGALFLALTQDLWTLAPESAQRIGHPAPFPVELAERLIRLYGYPGCHVLDPFAGSGTVGVAARKLGCRATLVDIDADYCRLAQARVQAG